MRRFMMCAVTVALMAAGGCNTRKDSKREAASQAAAAKIEAPAQEAAATASEQANAEQETLTPEEYERFMLELASCSIKGDTIDPECPARKAWTEARMRANRLRELAGLTATLGKKHIAHQSPTVRIQAAAFLGSVALADPGSQELLLGAARAEREPAVLISMLQSVGSRGAASPEIGKLLIEMADHESPAVRKRAAVWLGSWWNNGLAGSIEKLLAMIENDADMEVREFACKYSGTRGNDKLVAVYAKYTKQPDKEPRLYRACMEGLLGAWLSYPLFQTHNKKAYELTLQRISQKPRTKDMPPWVLLERFAELAKTDNKALSEWKTKATWYKPTALLAALESVVVDPDAYAMARTSALKSMIALGAPKAQLEKMRAAYKTADRPEDKTVIDALDQALAVAP